MRKLASVQTIIDLWNIPETDNLQIAQINGWQVVTNKQNNFKINDKIIYCEIDSILPEMPVYEFLRSKKFRIKTQKIRGSLSQGIIFPLSILYEYVNENLSVNDIDNFIHSIEEEQDVTSEMKITKYEPDIYNKSSGSGNINGKQFPEFLVKTDEERIQNLMWLFQQEHTKNAELAVYEKLEGCLDFSTIIETEYGNMTIGEICEKDLKIKVKTFNIKLDKIEYQPILNTSIKENKNNWYKIELENGVELIATENHKIFLPKLNDYLEVKEIQEGMEIFFDD